MHACNRAYVLSTTKPHVIVDFWFIPCPPSSSFNTTSTVFFLHLEPFLQVSTRDTPPAWCFSPHNLAIMKEESLITYPQVFWTRRCYQQHRLQPQPSRQQFRLQPRPPALTKAKLPVALITTTATSFDCSCSHSYQLWLQLSYHDKTMIILSASDTSEGPARLFTLPCTIRH